MGVKLNIGPQPCPWHEATILPELKEGYLLPATLLLCRDLTDEDDWQSHVTLIVGGITVLDSKPAWYPFDGGCGEWEALLWHEPKVPFDARRLHEAQHFVEQNPMEFYNTSQQWCLQFLSVWKKQPWMTFAPVNQYGDQIGPGPTTTITVHGSEKIKPALENMGQKALEAALTTGKLVKGIAALHSSYSKYTVKLIAQKPGPFLGKNWKTGDEYAVDLDKLTGGQDTVTMGVPVVLCPIVKDWVIVGPVENPVLLLHPDKLKVLHAPAGSFDAHDYAKIQGAIEYHKSMAKKPLGKSKPQEVMELYQQHPVLDVMGMPVVIDNSMPFDQMMIGNVLIKNLSVGNAHLPTMKFPDGTYRPVLLAWQMLRGPGTVWKLDPPKLTAKMEITSKPAHTVVDLTPTIYRDDLQKAYDEHLQKYGVKTTVVLDAGQIVHMWPGIDKQLDNLWMRMGLPDGAQVVLLEVTKEAGYMAVNKVKGRAWLPGLGTEMIEFEEKVPAL